MKATKQVLMAELMMFCLNIELIQYAQAQEDSGWRQRDEQQAQTMREEEQRRINDQLYEAAMSAEAKRKAEYEAGLPQHKGLGEIHVDWELLNSRKAWKNWGTVEMIDRNEVSKQSAVNEAEKKKMLAEYENNMKTINKSFDQITALRASAKWQAAAFSDKKRRFVFRNAETKEQAIAAAQNDCKWNDCKIVTSFTNACVATIWGMKPDTSNFDFVAQGKTEEDAKKLGISKCKASGANQCQASGTSCAGSADAYLEEKYAGFVQKRNAYIKSGSVLFKK